MTETQERRKKMSSTLSYTISIITGHKTGRQKATPCNLPDGPGEFRANFSLSPMSPGSLAATSPLLANLLRPFTSQGLVNFPFDFWENVQPDSADKYLNDTSSLFRDVEDFMLLFPCYIRQTYFSFKSKILLKTEKRKKGKRDTIVLQGNQLLKK